MNQRSLLDFKKSLRTSGATLRDVRDMPTLRKSFIAKAEEAGGRRLKFTISTNAVDLDNDTVDQSGWDLSVYKTNPVILWMHLNETLPLAKCVSIGIEGGKLKGTVEFLPASMPVAGPMADAVFQMCRGGFLSATSVGFLPLAFDIANDRMGSEDWLPPVNFTKQKLLEFSIVTVPANSEALIEPGQRDDAVTPPVEMQARAISEAAKLAMDASFQRRRRLSFLASQESGSQTRPGSGALPMSTRTPGGGMSVREKSSFRSVQAAMHRGCSNDEIRGLHAEGWLTIPANSAEAMRFGWQSADLHEARRRGLFI